MSYVYAFTTFTSSGSSLYLARATAKNSRFSKKRTLVSSLPTLGSTYKWIDF